LAAIAGEKLSVLAFAKEDKNFIFTLFWKACKLCDFFFNSKTYLAHSCKPTF